MQDTRVAGRMAYRGVEPKAGVSLSVYFLGPGDPLINRLASGESFVSSVPMSDALFAEFPAQQNDFPLHLAGKIEQSHIEILHLHTDRIDFGDPR